MAADVQQAAGQDPGMATYVELEQHLPALIEVHQTLYGGVGDESHLASIPTTQEIRSVVERCYELDAVYENPLLSFSSRPAITDAFLLSRYVSSLCVPELGLSLSPTRWLRGAADLVRSSVGWRQSGSTAAEQPQRWKIVNVWSECGDIAESESFDGFIVGILDHTLHIQLAPGVTFLHGRPTPDDYPPSPSSVAGGGPRPPPPPSSFFHVQLRMLSVFQFNEAGRIVFQRDHWDVRDVVEGIVPFAGLAGAIGRWAGGLTLRLAGRLMGGCGPDKGKAQRPSRPTSGTTTPVGAEAAKNEEKAAAANQDKADHAERTTTIPAPSSAPVSAFASMASTTAGTSSPLSPTIHVRSISIRSPPPGQSQLAVGQPSSGPFVPPASSSGGSSLTSPTLAASLLTTTPTRTTRQRRGTSSRSWGSSSARSGSVSLPGFNVALQHPAAAPAASGWSSESVRTEKEPGVLGLEFEAEGLAKGVGEVSLSLADPQRERALDHAP